MITSANLCVPVNLTAQSIDTTTNAPAGDARLRCGGTNENSVYELPVTDREYRGCVRAPNLTAVVSLRARAANMTPEECRVVAVNNNHNVYATRVRLTAS